MHRIESDRPVNTVAASMEAPFVHSHALVESDKIGNGTHIWAFAHVMPDAVIGSNCNVGDHGFIETGAVIGDNVTLKNHVCVWDGISIEDDAFVGPYVVFTNDRYPRSARMPEVRELGLQEGAWLLRTVVEQGCSIGAGATILPGLRLGKYSMIGAGSLVTRNVEPFALMVGSPAKKVGHVCRCGERMDQFGKGAACRRCAWVPKLAQ